MPGYPLCPWCHGKGCICCDAERVKREKAEAERWAKAELRWREQLASTAFLDSAFARILPSDARPVLRPDAHAFRYCLPCNGTGCVRCDESERLFLFGTVEGAVRWRRDFPDVRDLRDAVVRAETARRALGLDWVSEDAINAAFMPAFDAEYKRQFPDGPKPMASVFFGNPGSIVIGVSR